MKIRYRVLPVALAAFTALPAHAKLEDNDATPHPATTGFRPQATEHVGTVVFTIDKRSQKVVGSCNAPGGLGKLRGRACGSAEASIIASSADAKGVSFRPKTAGLQYVAGAIACFGGGVALDLYLSSGSGDANLEKLKGMAAALGISGGAVEMVVSSVRSAFQGGAYLGSRNIVMGRGTNMFGVMGKGVGACFFLAAAGYAASSQAQILAKVFRVGKSDIAPRGH